MDTIKINLSLFLIVTILTACSPNGVYDRTAFFPEVEIQPSDIPEKENIWVFILAGQSNMAGRGFVEPQDTVANERIFSINKDSEIIIAKEPLHFYESNLTGLDSGFSFAKTLTEQIPDSISILLIPTAVGGSSISQWLEDSVHRDVKLLTNFREKAKIGLKYGQAKGILWHQGESDANSNDVSLYQMRLSALFKEFRRIIGNENLPILVGELGRYSGDPFWQEINEQIEAYVLDDAHAMLIHTADLKHKGDKVHFDSESQRIMGERFANQFLKLHKL